jgi:L-fuconolactonase
MDGFRVIDAHVHFWRPDRLHYPWLANLPALQRPFVPGDFGALATGALDGLLFVESNCEPSESDAELDLVDELAARDPRIAGSVAFVDMTSGMIPERLDRLARRERIVGVRHNIQGQAPGCCLTPAFVAGVRALAAHGLTFDLCVTAAQLDDAVTLVRRCPDVRFVLDHCGKPSIRTDDFAPWATGIERLSERENVVCKISGLFTEARPNQRSADGLRPYVEHVRRSFGAERLLYGSDWPVVTLAGGEEAWRATIGELTAEWPAAERQLFYSENTIHHYALQRHAAH